jgi:D-alanyl-D-alanine carboxypeptidase/D-alanyl-D-alanine-endopeptidase (penicillin-binding protein 4)
VIRLRFLLLPAAGTLLAVTAAAPVAVAGTEPVAGRVARAVRTHGHVKDRFAVGVWNAETGDAVYRLRAGRRQRPASVLKLATTAAALLVLGPDHELATEVRAADRADAEGELAGDLWVVGGGDPGLCERFHEGGADAALRELAGQVRASGVRHVTGGLVLDERAFPDRGRPDAWDWEDGDWAWYGAPVSALTLNDGCVDVTVTPGAKAGDPARLKVAPRTGVVRFRNRLVTIATKKGHSIAFGPRDAQGRITATGKVWTGSTGYEASLACVEPRAFFGDVFRRALTAAGVRVDGEVRPAAADERAPTRRVARHATAVRHVVNVVNTSSQNLYAELLLRALGRHDGGEGTAAAGALRVRSALGFAEDDGLTQIDGCGLARSNAMSADAVGRVLLRMFASEHRLAFMQSLARPGQDPGTLRKRFEEERFQGRLLAKTGTLRDTTTLAGYARARDGNVYAFVVLVEGNNTRGKALQRAVVDALVKR